nr:methyltransferase regulatory domain-containing protein [Rhodoferax sp.]
MAGWDEGYVSDVGYTMGYYGEMNPLRLRLALLNAGWHAPAMATACELGFGQGVGINLHAAGAPVQWWGTDFNPSQAAFAQGLAQAAGAGARLFDDAFAEFAARPDVPEFDCIVLHGIWSWVSEKNRALIVEFIRQKLKVGGVAYISYNTQPGWSAFAPLRDLLALHGASLGAPAQGSVQRVRAALDFAQRLMVTNPRYARANPLVEPRLKDVQGKGMEYVAHEYLNQNWHPMLFADVARELEGAKLQFACSARLLDHIANLHMTNDQQALLADISDTVLRETVRDFMVNQQFRADLWVKGGQRLTSYERARLLDEQRVVLVQPAAVALKDKVKGTLGEVSLNPELYGPVLDALADHAPRTLGEVAQRVAARGLDAAILQGAVMVLAGAGRLAPAADEADAAQAAPTARKLNATLLQRQLEGAGVDYLASPTLGGGFSVGSFHQLLLAAMLQFGVGNSAEWARWVWQLMESRNQRVMKDGKALATAEEALAALTEQAELFAREALPILRALRIVPESGSSSKPKK